MSTITDEIGTPVDDTDIISILIATDIHLGYQEKDSIRGEDSFRSFEEILQIAQKNKVDMILLGGDLFHENYPSRRCLYEACRLVRKYCFGNRPSYLEFLSDQTCNFHDEFATVNYQEPNYNVSIPIFSIHGNHDDPSGAENLSALDILSINCLINYFGKTPDVSDITVSPILLKKGQSKLALYGLGNIRDERLNRTFLQGKVGFLRPIPDAMASKDGKDSWFNLMVLHQNRVMHGPTNYIPEHVIPPFFNLIVWGHEHECLIEPQLNPQQDFYISQPGSSIATSLSEGEAVPKHVGILRINGTKCNLQKIPLKTVRPFIIEEVILQDLKENEVKLNDDKSIHDFLRRKVESMILKAKEQWLLIGNDHGEDRNEENFPKPLIRLRVDYSGGFDFSFLPQRFTQSFVDRVANPKTILQLHRRRANAAASRSRASTKHVCTEEDGEEGDDVNQVLDAVSIQNMVDDFLSHDALRLLSTIELGDAVRVLVEKERPMAIEDETRQVLKEKALGKDVGSAIENQLKPIKLMRDQRQRLAPATVGGDDDFDQFETTRVKNNIRTKDSKKRQRTVYSSSSGSEDLAKTDWPPALNEEEEVNDRKQKKPASTRGRGRGRGRGMEHDEPFITRKPTSSRTDSSFISTQQSQSSKGKRKLL